jgi:hypothetical protein
LSASTALGFATWLPPVWVWTTTNAS